MRQLWSALKLAARCCRRDAWDRSMPFRRPRNTLISGIGVAGAVLAAVVATFALVSGMVAYDLTSVDQVPRSSDALVLGALRADGRSATPLVLGSTRAPAAQPGPAPAGP